MRRRSFIRPVRVPAALVAMSLGLSVGRPAENESTPVPEARDHLIFVGLTLRLEGAKVAGDLRDVGRGTVTLATAEGTSEIAMASVRDVEMHRQLVVSDRVVQIANLREQRTFTAQNNPQRLGFEQVTDMQYFQEQKTNLALMNLYGAETEIASDPAAAQELRERRERAAAEVASAYSEGRTLMHNTGDTIHRSTGSGADHLSDAFAVTFLASSPVPVRDVYAALLLQVRAPGVNEAVSYVRFRELPELGPDARKVTLQCTGLPQGYVIVSQEIHLYANGAELGTSLSEKAVAVERSEAFQFLLFRHLADNKKRSLPPQVVRQLLPADVAKRIPADALSRSAEVMVDENGTVTAVRLDAREQPHPVDDYVQEVLRTTPFLPALVQGVPAATETTVVFSELVR